GCIQIHLPILTPTATSSIFTLLCERERERERERRRV
ncbi:hypothetical protein ACMD2_20287, partial [Ananas comosus]